MSNRNKALAWLRSKTTTKDLDIFTSKFFTPAQSWTGKNAWWVQVPVIRLDHAATIHILCEAAPGENDFHYLQIPSAYFLQHLEDLVVMSNGRISLFLSAEPGNLFQDERSPVHIHFRQFIVNLP